MSHHSRIYGILSSSALVACGAVPCDETKTCELAEGTGKGGAAMTVASTSNATGVGGADTDTTAPNVVTTIPANGDSGVLIDQPIRIIFDEAMNQASVETALSSPTLGPMSYIWPEPTVLEITSTQLQYAVGQQANAYDFELAAGAADLAGNTLGESISVTFLTARQETVDLPAPIERATGPSSLSPCGDGSGRLLGVYQGTECRALATFDISSLSTASRILSATLNCNGTQFSASGEPFIALGPVDLHLVEFSEGSPPAGFDAAPLQSQFSVLSSGKTLSVDVAEELQNRVDAQSSLAQFRFQHGSVPSPIPNEDHYAVWAFVPTDPGCGAGSLSVTYLTP